MTIRPRTEFRPSSVYEQAEDAVEAALGCEFEFKYPGQDVAYPHNIILTFQRVEGRKHHPFRLKVTWPAVTENVMDEAVDVDGYTVQIQYSADGTTWTDENRRTKVIRDKDANNDGVDSAGPPTHALFFNIKPKKYYRARVRATGPGGLCKSPFSPWTGAFSATDSVAPSAPLNVALEVDNHRLVLTWDHPDDFGLGQAADEDTDIADNIAYYQWQVTNDTNNWSNTATYWKKGRTTGDRRTLKVSKPSGTYYARVRSWDAAGNKSSWVSASTAKGSVPNASIGGIAFDPVETKNRWRAYVTVTPGTAHNEEIDYIVQFVHKAANVEPTASDNKFRQRVEGDETSNGLRAVFKNIPIGHYTWARVRTVDADGDRSGWTAWTAGGQPSGGSFTNPLSSMPTINAGVRRLYTDWADSDSVEKWRVRVYKGGSVSGGVYTQGTGSLMDDEVKKASKHSYPVPRADAGSSHFFLISAIDGAGRESGYLVNETGKSLKTVPVAPTVSLAYDNNGPKGRPRANVTVTVGTIPTESYHIVVQLAQRDSAVAPVDGSPRRTVRLDDDGSTVAEFGGLKKLKYYYARARVVDADGDKSAWSSWVGGTQPSGAGGEGVPGVTGVSGDFGFRRFSVDWDDNDEVEKYRIRITRGTSARKTLYKKGSQHTYHIPEADRGLSHTMYIAAVDAAGNVGNEASATGSESGTVYVTNSDIANFVTSTQVNTQIANGAGVILTPNGLSDIDSNLGTIYAGEVYSSTISTGDNAADSTYVRLKGGTGFKDRVTFSSGGSSDIVALSGGILIGGAFQKVAFFGTTPVTKRSNPGNNLSESGSVTETRVNNIAARVNDLQTILEQYGLC